MTVHRLVGRESESDEIASVLASVRSGLSGVLVLSGEAGVGKTALLDAAATAAVDLDVVRIVGIESEIELGFAALHQLLSRFLGDVDALPSQQARALRTAFGLDEEASADRFLVGLAALTLLTDAATRRGILIVVDDAQWLDDETANVLGFVARRLYADRIGLLVAMHDTGERHLAFDGLPSITLDALSEDASIDLLESAAGGSFAEQVRTRILAEAAGNPLALLELSRELSQHQLAGLEALPQPLAVDERLEARFLRQVHALPADTQQLLLVVAAEPTGDPTLVRRAGRQLGLDEDAILPAEAEHLVSVGPPIRFRHSLIRSAIYHGATDVARRRAHEALAAATDVERDPDRRAWHRAEAARFPDEQLASELEDAAARARRHGGHAASASLLERAAQLTPEPGRRAIRYLVAAAADLVSGSSARAYANFSLALPDLDDPAIVAQARRLEAAILFVDASPGAEERAGELGRRHEIIAMMLDAAVALGPLDIRLARETVLDVLPMAQWFGQPPPTSVGDVARVAKSLQLPSEIAPTSVDLLLDALAELFGAGYRAAAPLLRKGLAAIRADPDVRESPGRMGAGCWAAFALSDDDAVQALAGECAAISRERGAFRFLPEALNYLGQSELRVGSLTDADEYFTEEKDLQALLRRKGPAEAHKLIVSAWRGREEEVRAAAPAGARDARVAGVGYMVGLFEYAMVILELSLGNYQAASATAHPEFHADVSLGAFHAADAIEAHARGGDRDVAEAMLAWLSERAVANESALDLGLLARSRALLVDDSEAEDHFQESIARLESSGGMLHLARARLLYGEWLRRQKRRRDAREQLAAALETFEAMGAEIFSERARVELLATGATARKRVDETRDDLTPQEEQIARLAAGGATNPEIAARLFISASTVDYHLRKVYRKLDIKSRRELGRTDPATS